MQAKIDMRGKTAFVTGGTGFVGSHLVDLLLKSNVEVRCLVRKEAMWLSGTAAHLVRGSLQDEDALRTAMAGAHLIFHVAGRTRGASWNNFERDNVTGTERLLKIAAETESVERVLVTSSLAAIGKSDTDIVDETAPLNPVSTYGRSKAEMERAVGRFRDRLSITIVRPPAVYGPRETDILTFFKTLSRGVCPIIGSPNKKALSLVHVDDLVHGMIQATQHPAAIGKTYFLGSDEQYSWGEIRDATCEALQRRVMTLPIPRVILPAVGLFSEWVGRLSGSYPPLNREKAEEILHAALMCDSSLAKKSFDYRPQVALSDGISSTIAWYKDHDWL
jgi:nucleoside-diphosphate-sugar epimerase